MFNKIFHKLFLSCKEVTYYMELKENNQLNRFQLFRYNIHLLICKYCKIYQKKREIITNYLFKETTSLENSIDEVTINNNQIDKLKTKISDSIFKQE